MARRRSYWAWGYEDRFPSAETRAELAERVGGALGLPGFGSARAQAPLPKLEAMRPLAEPRYTPPRELRGIGTTEPHARASHTYGRGYRDLVRGFRGEFDSAPDWVFYPTEEAHLSELFRFCEHESVALIPFGGGTGLVGGTEHLATGRFRGTACVDLTAMDRVLEVDSLSHAARIQAGASGPRIREQLHGYGLALRHYPQSFELSTLGGWIATRATGHYATLYTHIGDFVESVRMMTPAGSFETQRLPSSAAGLRPDALVLGSEGALGIITEAWVRLQRPPRWRASASVHFARFEDGVDAARMLSQSGLYPSNCRLLDPFETLLHQVANNGASVLLIAFESADHPVDAWMERALSIATDLGGQCDEPKYTIDVVNSIAPRALAMLESPPPSRPSPVDHDTHDAAHWKQAFLEAPYLQSALVSLGVVCDTFETACTWDRFAELHDAVTRAVGAAMNTACGSGLLSCRFTHVHADGPAPTYTFLAPGRPGDELSQWAAIKAAARDAVVAHGGGQHYQAVGRLYQPDYRKEISPLFASVLEAAKGRFDPRGILNPGCLLPSKP